MNIQQWDLKKKKEKKRKKKKNTSKKEKLPQRITYQFNISDDFKDSFEYTDDTLEFTNLFLGEHRKVYIVNLGFEKIAFDSVTLAKDSYMNIWMWST